MSNHTAVSLRPEHAGDESFLFEVYASTRAEELALTGWDAATRQTFLTLQFKAMRQGYRSMFPEGEFLIIETGGRAVGRMVLHRSANEIRVVDIALLPAHRKQGIGTILLQRVCAESVAAGTPVRLNVLKNNPAIRWYQRLGFTKTSEAGIYDEMEWSPAS